MAAINPVLSSVREATHQIHQRLEQRLDVIAALSEPVARKALVTRYHRFHTGIEAATRGLLRAIPDLDFEDRRRTASIAQTLTHLGQPLPSPPLLPGPASPSQALGLFYVAEGSSLGGRLLHRELATRGVDPAVFAFLDPYGENTGDRWRTFLVILEREARDDVEGAVSGAVAGFQFAEETLCAEAVAA